MGGRHEAASHVGVVVSATRDWMRAVLDDVIARALLARALGGVAPCVATRNAKSGYTARMQNSQAQYVDLGFRGRGERAERRERGEERRETRDKMLIWGFGAHRPNTM